MAGAGAWLEDLTWPEAERRFRQGAVVLVPIGAAAKEHGPHLPLGTDRHIARGLAEAVRQRLPVVVAPVIGFGYYPVFRRWAGSQHLSAGTFQALVLELLEGFVAQGVRQLAVLNTGVSTEAPLRLAARELFERHGVAAQVADIRGLGRAADRLLQQRHGGHACERETSLMLALAPEAVRMELAPRDYGGAEHQPPTVFHAPFRFARDPAAGEGWSTTGIRGDASLATAEKGRAILAAMIDDLVAGLTALFPALTDPGTTQTN